MALTQITAKKKIGDIVKEASINYDFGNSLEEMTKKFGAEVVFSNARGSFIITGQAAMRRYLETGKNPKEIADLMGTWKPGVALARVVDPVAAITSAWRSMTPEQKAEVIKTLKG